MLSHIIRIGSKANFYGKRFSQETLRIVSGTYRKIGAFFVFLDEINDFLNQYFKYITL